MVTVFTPTYNRADTLQRLYESLKIQTDSNFEWIIIDDASSDNTDSLIDSIITIENKINIRYVKQPHGGKHRAINLAVSMASFDWFFIVDSDDYISPNAIELINGWISKYGNEEKLAALSGSKKDFSTGKTLSVPNLLVDNSGLIALNHERYKYDLDLDKAEIYRTEILKKYPFPEYEGEYFVTEATCWNTISLNGYYTRFFPDVIYLCEYRRDGLTNSGANTKKGYRNNFFGFLDYLRGVIKAEGITWNTINLVIFAYSEINNHNITLDELCDRISIDKDTVKKIYSKRFSILILKIIMRCFNIKNIALQDLR